MSWGTPTLKNVVTAQPENVTRSTSRQMNYQEAERELARGRNGHRRLPGRSTYLHRVNGGIAMKYHDTDVVVWYPNGRVRLNNGGHDTLTTRQRMSRVTGVRVGRDRGRTLVMTFPGGRRTTYPYRNGMVIGPGGELVKCGRRLE